MINIWVKFEDKIHNTFKVIVFTRNHTDDDYDADDDRTKNKMSSPSPGGGRHKYIISISRDIILNRIIAQKEVMYNCTCIYFMVLEKYSLEPSGNAGT